MQATLISSTGTMVKAKLAANGRTVEFPIELLIDEDQEYIRTWAEENKTYKIRIDARKKMVDSDVKTQGNTRTNEKSYIYTVSVNNWGREEIDDLTVKYRVFTDEGYKEGSAELGALGQNLTDTFETFGSTLTQTKTTTIRTVGSSGGT